MSDIPAVRFVRPTRPSLVDFQDRRMEETRCLPTAPRCAPLVSTQRHRADGDRYRGRSRPDRPRRAPAPEPGNFFPLLTSPALVLAGALALIILAITVFDLAAPDRYFAYVSTRAATGPDAEPSGSAQPVSLHRVLTDAGWDADAADAV